MSDTGVLTRALSREKRARNEAESLLEAKSRELYVANQELVQLTDALRQQIQSTQTILNTAAEGILTFDDLGIIDSFNKAAEKIFGLPTDQALGRPIENLIAMPALPDMARGNNAVMLGVDQKLEGIRRDGCHFPMEMSISAVDISGKCLYVGIVRDVSERRMLEQKLALAQKLESVGQLAAGMAHEINTPIQYVGDNANFLGNAFNQLESLFAQLDELLHGAADKSSEEICRELSLTSEKIRLPFLREQIPAAIEQSTIGTQRVATIVSAMKEFSHPGTIEKSPTDLNQAIENTLTVSRNEWKYVAEVEKNLCETLPAVPCLPGEINQALLNLIVNAAHAISDSQTEQGLIRVTTQVEGEYAVITVEDNGCGIPDSHKQKLFEPFFTTKEVGRGTGQGLAIVYSVVVDKHRGLIDFESEPGRGTKFLIRLPLRSEQK